ncbi:MAG TPA: thiolase family protein [Pirellulales bacterium]|jgi:acetyl-CoA C-acetyltransferase|nr:thiolase family protein [Pirellulales bacterium]
MPHSYLLTGCRTPVGKFQGVLSHLTAPQLAAPVIAQVLRRTAIDAARVDEVILGHVLSAGVGQAPARQAALAAGLPPTVAAASVNKVCGSALKAVMLADQAIRAGDAQVIVAGGMESMSRAPYLLAGVRQGWKFGDRQAVDSMLYDGLWCPFENCAMGDEADYIAVAHAISREDQDAFGLESHRRAVAAQAAGSFAAEIVPLTVDAGKGPKQVDRDEGPRADTSLETLARLKPGFNSAGTVTAGNSSQLSDGAAVVVVASEAVAREHESPLRARIVAHATAGVPPKEIFIAPVGAVQAVLAKADLRLSDIDLIEMNEAFAAQSLACMRALGIDAARLNVNGGAIALGHPIGASGARVLVTLMHTLAARGLRRGLVTVCLGGGNAVAMIIERA